MEPIYLLEHLLVHSYLIQGEFEEFHEKKAAIYPIANHFQFHVAKPPFPWHETIFSIQSGVIYVNIVSRKMSEHLIMWHKTSGIHVQWF